MGLSIDLEKIINEAFDEAITEVWNDDDYFDIGYNNGLEEGRRIALAMLKEPEAVEPRRIDGKRNHFIKCGNCNYDLLTGYMFCPHCGKAVKWE